MTTEIAHTSLPKSLSDENLKDGISYLRKVDPDLDEIVSVYGPPPLWSREPGFPTLVHIILEQQVSLASAKAAFTKLKQAAGELTPMQFLQFSDKDLREFGFSRQKARYGRELSKAILNGELDLDQLDELDDNAARNTLMQIVGIGSWTANIYLLMALLRPDIWPSGDLALEKAFQTIKDNPEKPESKQIALFAKSWKPYRAVAARILWHFYLNR